MADQDSDYQSVSYTANGQLNLTNNWRILIRLRRKIISSSLIKIGKELMQMRSNFSAERAVTRGLPFPIIYLVMALFTGYRCTSITVPETNKVPGISALPDPLVRPDGKRVSSINEWAGQRTYLKKLLKDHLYGEMPARPDRVDFRMQSSRSILGESLIEETFQVVIERNKKSTHFSMGIRRPNRPGQFPIVIKNDVFLFDITEVTDGQKRNKYKALERDKIEEYVAHQAIARNYIICKFNRNEVAPDSVGGHDRGVQSLYPELNWGSIATWAWTYQVLIDYFEEQPYADSKRIVATGHSRGGKAALCAGVYEERIAITAPSSSGAGGTASWAYFYPSDDRQLLQHHRERFPHWWNARIFEFVGREGELPFDAHYQKALIAPRGLINVHSRDDLWANPYGTYLTYLAAEPIFHWLGAQGNQGVHWRNGPHNQNQEDWFALFEFCDKYFFGIESRIDFTQNPNPEKYHYDSLLLNRDFSP